ncbi:hypothetical protein AYR66_08160 [Noviherbaspirillum denitrificans]|uniref:OmpR/PhoB-type domain-containing protein n=2 Tax=Noviherbaspirillum denitrificans TaxID=1968433 RepID=A0A254TBF4_9BURK|nr:hypothetical protein AYR66_08160 [Noviherbaspirillum denitrificans]
MYGQVLDVLARHGFHCIRFTSDADLLEALASNLSTVVLAARSEIAAGSIRSWRACRERALPVIILSPAVGGESTVRVLDEGADDVVALAMGHDEFAARLNAVLRAYQADIPRHSISLAGFEFDVELKMAADRGRIVELTPAEFSLAWLLFSCPGTFLSRDALSMAVCGRAGDIASRTLEQHIYKLRRKLKLLPDRGVQIRMASGRGYILEIVEPFVQEARERGA